MTIMTPENRHILENLERIAETISQTFGKNCEVCVHDVADLRRSLIYLAGNTTGRSTGAPATDLLTKALKNPSPEDLHNYVTTTSDGRVLKSSTSFIRNSSGEVVAALCINFDTTDFFNAAQALSPFITQSANKPHSPAVETFSFAPEETLKTLFDQAVEKVGRQPSTMSTDEKIDLVKELENLGVFQFKGAVEQVAALTGVSKFTIYNYRKKLQSRIHYNQF